MRSRCIIVGLIYLIMLSAVTPCFGDKCRGDIDGDGAVDGSDVAEMASDFGNPGCPVKTIKYIKCEGTLSTGGRWCDNADGTVTDMTTGLIWLKNAGWGGRKAWMEYDFNDAHTRAGTLANGTGGLNDGSVVGQWRLPTVGELIGITQEPEAVSLSKPRWFTGLPQSDGDYWSSTTVAGSPASAWLVDWKTGSVSKLNKRSKYYFVWPVRGSN